MARNYIEGSFEVVPKTSVTVDLRFPDGSEVCDLEVRRLFPMNYMEQYITLLDSDGKEYAIIRDISTLSQKSADVIRDALSEYYIIPKINQVIEVYEKGSINRWTVMTDRGMCSFHIKSRYSDIKPFSNGRVLIRDTNDNRYEIPDVKKLDKRSLRELNSQI